MGAGLIRRRLAASASDAGVTLVELLVVVAVLAVLGVGTSLLAVRGSESAATTSDLAWFRRAYEQSAALAIEGRSPRGLSVTPSGLVWLNHDAQGWHSTRPARGWQGRVTLASRGLRAQQGAPDIALLATGQGTAFSITFTGADNRRHRCETDGWAELSCTGG